MVLLMNFTISTSINCKFLTLINKKNQYKNAFWGPLAQLVEQFPFKEWVDGSSPSGLTTYAIGGYLIIISFIQFVIL